MSKSEMVLEMSDNKEQILRLILQSDAHPTADDIHFQLRAAGKRATLATVYNNLHALCQEGRIRRITFDNKGDRYDRPMRHDHLICSCCGRISDITLQDLTATLEEHSGVELDYYDLKLFYRCADCRAKAQPESPEEAG